MWQPSRHWPRVLRVGEGARLGQLIFPVRVLATNHRPRAAEICHPHRLPTAARRYSERFSRKVSQSRGCASATTEAFRVLFSGPAED